MKSLILIFLLLVFGFDHSHAAVFDHQHTVWNLLLSKHVKWISEGTATRVDYAGFKKDNRRLKNYLSDLSSVELKEFNSFSRDQRLAFLINAYNAFTVDLILTKYPEVESIKDLGTFLKSPWKREFFTLFGETRYLDDIEHGMIRKPGAYDEPRIHFTVVCAAIGCPGLRNEAFTAGKLNSQLEDSLRRFLSDKSRNRYNSKTGIIEVSKIFKWYQDDFEKGKYSSLKKWFAIYADLLSETETDRQKIKNMTAGIDFLDYDWKLNDI